LPKSKPILWRDILPIHPAANALPLLAEDALRELAEDIKKNGLHSKPVVLLSPKTKPTDPDDYVLLDGRNRLDALELLGVKFLWRNEVGIVNWHLPMATTTDYVPTWSDMATPDVVGAGGASVDAVAYVISANLARRHLRPRDIVMHAIAIRATSAGSRSLPIKGVERRDEDGVLRQTATSVVLSKGGRGRKGEALAIAEQTGVNVRTVQRVIAEQKPVTVQRLTADESRAMKQRAFRISRRTTVTEARRTIRSVQLNLALMGPLDVVPDARPVLREFALALIEWAKQWSETDASGAK